MLSGHPKAGVAIAGRDPEQHERRNSRHRDHRLGIPREELHRMERLVNVANKMEKPTTKEFARSGTRIILP